MGVCFLLFNPKAKVIPFIFCDKLSSFLNLLHLRFIKQTAKS